MNILIISHFYKTTPPIGTGSIEFFTDNLANALAKDHSNNVLVICKTGSTGGLYKIKTTEEPDYINVVLEQLNNFKPDVIHIMFDDLKLFDILSKINIPVIYTIMSYARPSHWPFMVVNSSENFTFIAVSENFRNYLMSEFKLAYPNHKVDQSRVLTIGLGFDVADFITNRSKIKSNYYLYLGLIRKHKGVLEIVKYFSTTNRKLKVAGPVKNIPYCHEVLEIIKKSKNIEYLGEILHIKEKIELLSKARALVIATGYSPLEPDCHEAFGTVMVESNACGTPVIGYKQGVMEEYIVNGKNGFLFTKIEEINSIFKMIEFDDMSLNCISSAMPFQIEKIANKYQSIYKKSLKI